MYLQYDCSASPRPRATSLASHDVPRCRRGAVRRCESPGVRASTMSGWYRAKTSGPLTPPCRYQMAHDLVGDTLYVHGGGGQGSATQQRRSLLWALDVQTMSWKELDGPRRSLVTSRSNHTLTYCAGSLTVFGGKGLGAKAVDMVRERKLEHGGALKKSRPLWSLRSHGGGCSVCC